MGNEQEIARLMAILKQGGDPRLGGSLPLGGKAYASYPNGEARLPSSVGALLGGKPPLRDEQAYNEYMNIIESMLQDQTRGAGGIPWEKGRQIPAQPRFIRQ